MEEYQPPGWQRESCSAGLRKRATIWTCEFMLAARCAASFLDLMDDGGRLVSQFESLEVVRIYDPTPGDAQAGYEGL